MATLVMVLTLFAQDADVKARLKATKVTVDFQDQDLQAFIEAMGDATGLNFALYGVDRHHAHITMTLTDVSAETVLALALMDHKLATRLEENVILIEKRGVNAKLLTRGYDVRELLFITRDFPGMDIAFDRGGLGIFEPDNSSDRGRDNPFDASWLVELIRAHTGDGSWENDERVAISVFDNCLFVKQSDGVHKQIDTLIQQLRKVK